MNIAVCFSASFPLSPAFQNSCHAVLMGLTPPPAQEEAWLASANQHDPISCHKDGLLGGQELKTNRKTDTNKKTPGQSTPPEIGFGSGVGWAQTSAG